MYSTAWSRKGMFEECYVESWRRKTEPSGKGKEFISFKIILKFNEFDNFSVERRYSEFHKLHQQVNSLSLYTTQFEELTLFICRC